VLIRPLLDTARAEIEAYCADHQLEPRQDPSNQATYYTRNRIRADLMPILATYNQHIITALGRTASVCADDYAYIQSQLDALWPTLTEDRPGAVYFQAAQWQQIPTALQRYALRRAAALLVPGDDLSYDQVEASRDAAMQGAGFQHTPGQGLLLRVEHHGFLLIHDATYEPDKAADTAHTLPQISTGSSDLPLVVPGDTFISRYWYLQASYSQPEYEPATYQPPGAWQWQVVLDVDSLNSPLLVRGRKPGDRFRPAGGVGTRRLQDFFVDQKLPRELRAAWPILATSTHVVWVSGLRVDERFQATDQTRHRLWVTLKRSKLYSPSESRDG
jgi:tRNA(Ile)-lysidine synthase